MCCWRRLDRLLDCKGIEPVNPKGNQPWIFTGRPNAEAKAPIFWPPDMKSWLIGKDPVGKEGRKKQKGMAEDEMVRQHYWLSGHEFEKIPRDSGGQRSLVCCSQWGCRVRHDLATQQQLCDSVIPLLDIFTREMKAQGQRFMHKYS